MSDGAKIPEIPQSFEAAFQRLQEIVDCLDRGGLTLDELEACFEEGLRLSRFCSERLNKIEGRIEVLLENPNGDLETRPFDS